MKSLKRNILMRIVVECVVTSILLCVALNFFEIFKHTAKRGFFCDDESLKYPYRADTIDETWLYFLSLYVPIILIINVESFMFLLQRKQAARARVQGYVEAFLNFHHNLTPFLCGFAVHAIFVHTAKITVGRLRPYFFEICQPYRKLDGSSCDDIKNNGIYIQDYECNVPHVGHNMLIGLHLSFPSGHASYIFYGMIFIVLYLQRINKALRHNGINVGLIMMTVQMLCVLLAWFVAVSRLLDYKHHWSDILVGIMLGTSVAIAFTHYVCQQLKNPNDLSEGVNLSNSASTSTTTFSTTMPSAILVP